jgi:aspartyl-tRNA(Asn)/glutamyl-tRNA(Gln) amidotransferase subunit A
MTEFFFKDISAVADSYKKKDISPVDVTKQLLSRIEKLSSLNAFIHVMADSAIQDAQRLEKELINGEIRGPLHGIPIAIKDIIQTKGVATTAGSKVLQNWIPDEDATVIKKLKNAGAILIGKTNLHEFAMGATSENPHYGVVKNPWDTSKIAGGSSGGSAVAVAAGMCFGAIGTDTAGSIRLPAALCGCVGIKPTYGTVSKFGTLPFSWSLDHIGPMARNVKDTAIILRTIAGYDNRDDASARKALDINLNHLSEINSLKGWKIGICREYFFEDMHAEIADLMNQAFHKLTNLGADLVEIQIPGISDAIWAQKIIAQAEAYSFHEPMLNNFAEMYGADTKYRLSFGRKVTANDYLKAQKIRKRFVQQVLQAMQHVDMMLSPTNHMPPFNIGSVSPEQSINNMYNLSKAPLINLIGFPAISVPYGFTSQSMPAGLQFVAKPFKETKLLQIAHTYEQTGDHWKKYNINLF